MAVVPLKQQCPHILSAQSLVDQQRRRCASSIRTRRRPRESTKRGLDISIPSRYFSLHNPRPTLFYSDRILLSCLEKSPKNGARQQDNLCHYPGGRRRPGDASSQQQQRGSGSYHHHSLFNLNLHQGLGFYFIQVRTIIWLILLLFCPSIQDHHGWRTRDICLHYADTWSHNHLGGGGSGSGRGQCHHDYFVLDLDVAVEIGIHVVVVRVLQALWHRVPVLGCQDIDSH